MSRASPKGIVVRGGQDEGARELCQGRYVQEGRNHGKPTFRKVSGEVGWIYFWEDKDDQESIGWWMSEEIGSDQVWAFNPSKSASMPPICGWKAPFDGPVDASFVLSYEDQPSTASSSGSCAGGTHPEPAETTSTAHVCSEAMHVNEDFCQVCQKAGKLLLCEHCPRAFHVHCIERLMELDEEDLVAQRRWKCPICLHGEGILQGSTGPQYSEAEMEQFMQKALAAGKRHRSLSQRRRDLFLCQNYELVVPFISGPARARILKASESSGKLPLLEIGSKVTTMATSGSIKGERYTAYILNQTASSRYLIVDAETGVEAEVERHMLAAIEGNGDDSKVDFYANARTPVLSERAKLKDYQIRGVNWLVGAVLNSGGGILADDMGLGKTVQTLALLSWLRSTANYVEPFCVVCPVSCVGNWIRECKRFVPHLSVAKLCGGAAEEKQSLDNDEIWYGMKDIIVTTYEAIKACDEFFQRHTWGVLVLDEAHRIKSQFTQSRQALDTIPCASRVLLTGTPLQNHLNELYELLRFLWPDVLGAESEVFQGAVQLSETGIDWNGHNDSLPERSPDAVVNSGKVEQVRALLSMMMLRRKKNDVISLPPKIARDVWLPLTPTQVSWYKAMLNCRFEAKQQREMGIRDMFQLITRLRLTCAHPRCILSSEANEKKLRLYNSVDMNALQTMADAGMTEQMITESAKLSFLDKLLSHLHAQNLGMNSEWRQQFEDRQARVIGKQYKKRSASQWLKSSEGILFLDEMRPWRPTRNVGARLRSAPAAAEEGFSAAIGADAHCPSSSSTAGPNVQKSTDSGANIAAHANGSASSSNGKAGDSDGEEDTPRPHKVLIFSQYHMCLDLLEDFCAFRGWRALRLDGSTNRIVRELDMRDFNSEDETYFVYLIGTRAGGLGINLHTANHVVLFDHDWNPHVDSQAIDRAHRIGQHRSVNIYRLIQEWSVEEKLVHRQEIKLKMEKCVISAKTDEDPGFDVKERLSGTEVLELLRHGEATLRKFAGEALDQKSLQDFLDRARRPLLETDCEENGHAESHLGEEFVEDDETMGTSKQDDAAPVEEAAAEVHAEASPKVNGKHKEIIEKIVDEPNVMRSRSGRIIRPVVQFSQLYEPVEPKRRKKLDIKHDKLCFLCGERHKECASAREEEEEPEFECAVCPKVYHRSCLGAGVESQKRRWTCGWHHCNRCGRGPSACGGMLMHCQSCPTALCYDCFPPNFRRVTPDPKFWTDLQKKNWNMSPQKMMLFRCNSCLALAEQRKRQLMRQEDLEAQADAKKRQALEEKRNWAAKRRTRENEEARRRLRQVMGEHERAALQDALQDARDKLKCAFENLGPEDMKGSIKSKYLQKIGCLSCGFPGHKHHQCPFPREKNATFSATSTASTSKGVIVNLDSTVHVEDNSSEGAQKKKVGRVYVCSICNSYSHGRLQCPSMKREQREEYESRIQSLNDVADNITQMDMLKVLGRSMDLTQGLSQNVEIRLQEKVHEILRSLGLEHLILEPLLSEPEPKINLVTRQAPKAKAKIASMTKIPFKVKTLAKAKAKATSDGKGSGKSKRKGKQSKEVGVQSKMQNLSEVQVRWQVVDGVAWGWEFLGGFHPNGLKYLRYRRPGETEFIEQKNALLDLDPDVYEVLKGERANVLKELDNLAQKAPQHAKSKSKTDPAPTEKRPSKRSVSGEGSHDPNAILPGYIHMYKFPSGPAMDWQMRIRVGGNGALVYSYQRPNSQKWEYTIEGFKDDPAWQEIQSVRDIQSKHIRSKLVVTGQGAALAAALKRKAARAAVLPVATDAKRPRAGGAQVCSCGARNKFGASFCNACGRSLSKALNGHSESHHAPNNGHGHAVHPSSNGMSKNGKSPKGRSNGQQMHIELEPSTPRLDEAQPATPESLPGTPH